jgi:hypothetical protein
MLRSTAYGSDVGESRDHHDGQRDGRDSGRELEARANRLVTLLEGRGHQPPARPRDIAKDRLLPVVDGANVTAKLVHQ